MKKKLHFRASGVSCKGCEEIIRQQALKVEGVKKAGFDYANGAGVIEFDSAKTDASRIFSSIEEKGYECSAIDSQKDRKETRDSRGMKKSPALGWVFVVLGIALAFFFLMAIAERVSLPKISPGMGYSLLFLAGILTGFHCVAMCGGFVIGYTSHDTQEGRSLHRSHILYAIGKTVSYTIVGAAFGLLGSFIAMTPFMRGVAGIIAGLFLVVFGMKMLDLFGMSRLAGALSLRTPKPIARLVGRFSSQSSNPLALGLLNGLMLACGPLQAIYVMAAGTGSAIEGAKLLFIFAIGTLPVMLAFGYFAAFISGRMKRNILKVSGAVIILLGIIMLNNSLVLSGSGFDARSVLDHVSGSWYVLSAEAAPSITGSSTHNIAVQKGDYQEIRMVVDSRGFSPNEFVLKQGMPVHWIIDGRELNGCNSGIIVNAYGLDFNIRQGVQTIEFTPDKEGSIRWSCWMGMIPGTFIVTKDLSTPPVTVPDSGSNKGEALGTATGAAAGVYAGRTMPAGCGCGGIRQI